jgi:hypothetical protein
MEAAEPRKASRPYAAVDGKTPPLSPLRASIQTKSGRSRSHVVLGSVLVVLMLGGFALLLPILAANAPEPNRRARGPDPQAGRIGTVTLSPDGEHCRQMTLDNHTGKMVEAGRIRCATNIPVNAEEAVRQRYSGGRLDAIRKSFSDR